MMEPGQILSMDHVQPTMPYWFPVLPTMLLAFGVLAWLAWNRWLSHKETMRAAELGGNSRAALGLREQWRARHGVLWAARVLALGVALVIVGVFADKWETTEVVGAGEDTAAVAVDAERAGAGEGGEPADSADTARGVEGGLEGDGGGLEEVMEEAVGYYRDRGAEQTGSSAGIGVEGEDAETRLAHAYSERRVKRGVLEPQEMMLLIGAAVCLLLVGAVTLIAYAIWSRRDAGVLALGLLGEERKIAPDAGEEAEEQSAVGGDAEGERSE